MEKKGLNKIVVIGSIVCSLVLLGVLGSYAYFMGNLGLSKNEEVSTETGSMSLIFSDGNNGIVGGSLEFGGSIEKTFNIQNNGTLNTSVKINWDNLTNTYLNGSLTYTLSYSETPDGEYTELITDKNVPRSESPRTKLLASNIAIPKETTYYYKLKITLNYLNDVDQTPDLKAMLSTQFSIEEFTEAEQQNIMMARVDNTKIWAHKSDIKTIVFEPSITDKPKTAYTYDLSQNGNEKVMGKLVPDEVDSTKYTLYIQADRMIYANENCGYLFQSFTNLESINGLEYFDTSNVTNMAGMFELCTKLTSLDLSSFDTSNVTTMQNMFAVCGSLTTLNLSKFDTSNVTTMSNMFVSCSQLTSLDLSNFDTSNVTNMNQMFGSCLKLTTLDVSSFDTANVTDMEIMFGQCPKLASLNLSNFNTSNVITMRAMFSGCQSLISLNLNNFNTDNVTDMSNMFSECINLTSLDISNFNTSNVTDMHEMFYGCQKLTTTFTVRGTKCTSYNNMFINAATNSEASITVNYTADASTLVNNMISTKSSNSNVKKGVQVA